MCKKVSPSKFIISKNPTPKLNEQTHKTGIGQIVSSVVVVVEMQQQQQQDNRRVRRRVIYFGEYLRLQKVPFLDIMWSNNVHTFMSWKSHSHIVKWRMKRLFIQTIKNMHLEREVHAVSSKT